MPSELDDDKEVAPIKGRGVKLNNKNSSIPPPVTNQAAAFSEKATMVFNKFEEFKKRTWELSSKFKAFVEDKILPENKSSITKDLEMEVLNNLVSLANEMNADEHQPEGIGGVALCMLLMKCILIQRDTVNLLYYKIDKLEKQVVEIKSNVDIFANSNKK